jgi:hypothetical protein
MLVSATTSTPTISSPYSFTMQAVRRFVQFPHPGPEGGPERVAWVRGNADHVRKLMVSTGDYRTTVDGSELHGEIAFWCEWEAESRYVRANGYSAHRPLPPSRDQWPRGVPQNTDPFVFGDHFLYTFCRQIPRAKQLHVLAPGSVIVFGSVLHHRFVCDTVLVVADSVIHTRSDWPSVVEGLVPEQFVVTTLEPMYAWPFTANRRYTLYIGATSASPIDGMFSFVPCQPSVKGRFERPAVDDVPGLSPRNARAVSFNRSIPPAEVSDRWRQLAESVIARGLALGTRIELP